MPTLDITDDTRDRIETLRAELAAAHAGEYASVETDDALSYLLDLAEAVDDPDRTADPEAFGTVDGEPDAGGTVDGEPDAGEHRRDHEGTPFDVDHVRERLEARNRRHGDPDDADEMDLYSVAAAFDVTGRSEMTKAELIEAILDAAERLAADPFAGVDVDIDAADGPDEAVSDAVDTSSEGDADEGDEADGDEETDQDDESDEADQDNGADQDGGADQDDESDEDDGADEDDTGGSSQLDAMMSLLDTHDDKWREGDGDARYEVDLPDGSVETARTKDDVRALLFKNY